jgi:excisionase family DNA binding protein
MAIQLGAEQLRDLAQERHFLTTTEAAEILRLKRRTLEDMRITGKGPRYYKMGPGRMARVVYRRVDLDAWVDQYMFKSTSEY